MKKLFILLTIALFGASMWSCSYDDDDLWNAVDGLDGRVEAMEKAMKSANTNIDALQKIVDALQKNVTVTSVVTTDNGYTINFSDGKTATITNGKDGTTAPAISVVKDTDGLYYWALDGKIIEVDGKKIKAEGTDGTTPQLRINPDTKEWEMSVDGTTWTSMGVKAEGSDGKDGDSMFKSVDTTTTSGFAIFTLKDGSKIEMPMQGALQITLSAKSWLFDFDEKSTFTITSKGAEKLTWTKPDGWKVSVDGTTLTVTAPAEANSYAERKGVIALIGLAGNFSCMAELEVGTFENKHTISFEGEDWSKWVAANYNPGKYSTTQMGNTDNYLWVDAASQLTTGRPTGFMGGWGYPWFVSSYNSKSLEQSKYGGYKYDLYVYNPTGEEDSTTGGGCNGSDNFLTTFGYMDLEHSYGDGRPILKFADGKARTIQSLYVNSTCYFYSVAMAGNELSPQLTKNVTYYATGYDADDKEIKTITMTFATPEAVTKTWTKWDLSELGPIVSLRLNQAGGADNGYGYSLPAYYALDDITVAW